MAWVLQLEDQRILRVQPAVVAPAPPARGRAEVRPAPLAVPDLARLVEDADARIRRRAALAIGRVGLAEGVDLLVRRLGDSDPDVRQMAAFALGLIGDAAAVGPLTAALRDPDPVVQGRAAEAIGLIGATGAAPAVATMVSAHAASGVLAALAPDQAGETDIPGVEAFRLGVFALARLRSYEALASAILGGDGRPITHWWPVAYALQRIENPRAVPALMALLRSEGMYTRAFAADGLGKAGDRAATAALIPLMTGWRGHPFVAVAAARALARLADPSAAAACLKVLAAADTEPALRLELIRALGAMHAADAVPILIDFVSDASPPMRAAALAALQQIDPEYFALVLSGLDLDPHWAVRAALARIVESLDPQLAVPRVRQLLADADQRVVPAALSALVRLKPPGVDAVLLQHLAHDDPVVRAAAATGLGEIRPQGGAAALADAYRKWQRDPTYVARASALEALARYGRDAARPTLLDALGDREWAVRIRAAALLQAFEAPDTRREVAAKIRPVPDTGAAAPYDSPEMVAPSVSPHVFIETTRGTIEIELAVLDAPQTCHNFMTLVRKGFFNGVPFHRVEVGFVVQGGDPRGDGEGGPGYTIRDEPSTRPFLRGTVGMAKDWADTAGSQFFITHLPQPHLDGRYTAFGSVVAGMEVVDAIRPWDVITSVRVWDGKQ